MIKIYFTYPDNLFKEETLEYYFDSIPDNLLEKIQRYKKREDQRLHLASILLLKKALDENGHKEILLNMLSYSEKGRPYFNNCSFDFNLSHTENCAAVVFSENCRVGIDIERIKKIDFSDFINIFSQEEWDEINSSKDKEKTFYYYWTLLESAVKADGHGLTLISSKNIVFTNDHVIINGKKWFHNHNNFDPKISCCVTSSKKDKIMELHEIHSI
jgi:4'-phosphopantetheinyl transferase